MSSKLARQSALARLVWLVCMLVMCVGSTTGCEDPEVTETEAFETAEAHYRDGEYEAALDGYQAFLDAYPSSPLADTAELRIRSINREVGAVMMDKDLPRPHYRAGDDPPEGEDLGEASQ